MELSYTCCELPAGIHCGGTVEELIFSIYPNKSINQQRHDNWFSEHTILSCKNDDVDHLNSDILKMFPGEIMQSTDFPVADNPDEYLQHTMSSLWIFGRQSTSVDVPFHTLHQKLALP